MEQHLRGSLLHALGDGATMEMADRALAWFVQHQQGVPPYRIGGVTEVAALLGRTRTMVDKMIWDDRRNCPQPFRVLGRTRLYDLDQWRVWAHGNPDLVEMSD